MLCSKIRVQTNSLILLITYLVNFYPIYSISPQKTNEAFSSNDSSESSDCYYSDSEGYCADSEGSSDSEILLHPGEYPEKTSFSNPIPRRKNEKWSRCSSGTEELRVYFGESSESSHSSYSREYSGSSASPYSQKSSDLPHSSPSKEHSDSGSSSCSQESLDSSRSSYSREYSGSSASPYSQKSSDLPHSSPSKEHSDSGSSSCSQESLDSSRSSYSREYSGSSASPYSQKSSDLPHSPPSKEHSDSGSSSSGEINSPTTVPKSKNLNPDLEERNLILEHMIENVSSHMADRTMIAHQKIKCYIKDVLLDKSIYKQLKPELLIAVMCYWDRINYVKLINDTKDEKNELDRFFYTLITLLCIADKFAGDDFCNITILKWAWASLVPLTKLIHYEKVLLENIDYRLYVSREDYLYYKEILKSCTNSKTS